MTVLDRNNTADLGGLQQSLQRRLHAFGQRVRGRLMIEAAARCLALGFVLALVTFLLDRTLRLSHLTRQGLLLAYLATIGIVIWRRLLSPLRMKLDAGVLASALESRSRAPIAARVATVLELPQQHGDASSVAMVQTAVQRSHKWLEQIDFEARLDPQRRNMAAGVIGAVLFVSLLLIVLFPSSARLWAARLFAGSNEPWPQRTYLQVAAVKDGLMIVPRGEPFVLRAFARRDTVAPDNVSIRWRQEGSPRTSTLLTKFAANDFRYDFPAIQSDVELEIAGGDDVLGPLKIHPIDRPRLVDLKLTSQHPTDRQPRVHNFSSGDDAGDLAFLPLTKMQLAFTANTPIGEAKITSSTTRPSGDQLHRVSDREFSLSWEHANATQLQIELTSVEASLAAAPTNVSIGLKTDKPPRASLGYTGVRARVTPQATIPLVAEARDDYGIQQIDLQFKSELPESEDPQKLKMSATTQPVYGGPSTKPADPPETDVRQSQSFELASLQLQPGTLLTFTAAATDTCYPTPQVGLSRQVTLRVVRPEELFKEILLRQQSERARFRKQFEEARRVREALNGSLDTETLSQLARQHRSIQREVIRTQTALSDSLTEMRLNVLSSPDAYKMMENNVLGPMKKLDAELLVPQRDALDSLAAADADAKSAAVGRQDQIVSSMEEILRQMAQWDSFIDVLNQLNEIIRLENQVEQGTNQLKRSQTERVFDP